MTADDKTFTPGDRVHLVSNERFTILGAEEDPARRLTGEVIDANSFDDKVKVRLDRELGTVRISIARVEHIA